MARTAKNYDDGNMELETKLSNYMASSNKGPISLTKAQIKYLCTKYAITVNRQTPKPTVGSTEGPKDAE